MRVSTKDSCTDQLFGHDRERTYEYYIPSPAALSEDDLKKIIILYELIMEIMNLNAYMVH